MVAEDNAPDTWKLCCFLVPLQTPSSASEALLHCFKDKGAISARRPMKGLSSNSFQRHQRRTENEGGRAGRGAVLSQPATPRPGQAACQALLLTAPRDAVHQESQGLSALIPQEPAATWFWALRWGVRQRWGLLHSLLSCGPIQEVASWQKNKIKKIYISKK